MVTLVVRSAANHKIQQTKISYMYITNASRTLSCETIHQADHLNEDKLMS